MDIVTKLQKEHQDGQAADAYAARLGSDVAFAASERARVADATAAAVAALDAISIVLPTRRGR